MLRSVLPLIACLICFSCQRNPAGPGGTTTILKSDLAGYWAQYKSVVANDYVDGTGQRIHQAYTTNDSLNISEIVCFDTVSLQWYTALNHPACYTLKTSCPYEISGDTLIASAFEGIQTHGSDTLRAVNVISKENGEIIILTSLIGNWNGQPARLDNEYHYCRVDGFPPPYWPSRQCY